MDGEFEYLRLEIVRNESTDLYLKVPKGWRPKGKDYKLVGKAAKETVSDYDWDNYGRENNVEIQSCVSVEADEAELYTIFDISPHLPKTIPNEG